tara:strand:- start:899 stop:1435 length:537 start_codon:yes stop_codon:yes gene_type:complete
MTYEGKGRSALYADIGREEAAERGRFETQLSRAEDLRGEQSDKKALVKLLGKGFYAFGPVPGAIGESALPALVDYSYRKPEEAFVSTDTGKFGVDKRYDYREINRKLRTADKAETWQDVTDIGTSLFSAWQMGGGSMEDPGAFRAFRYGSEDNRGSHGRGIFGKGGTNRQSVWDQWFS